MVTQGMLGADDDCGLVFRKAYKPKFLNSSPQCKPVAVIVTLYVCTCCISMYVIYMYSMPVLSPRKVQCLVLVFIQVLFVKFCNERCAISCVGDHIFVCR